MGKTVQVVPHITDAIQDWIERVAEIPVDESGLTPDVCIVEVYNILSNLKSWEGLLGILNQLHLLKHCDNFNLELGKIIFVLFMSL